MGDITQAAEVNKLLCSSVEESRAKRLEKQQSRYRDRGGLFVPAESNPLLEVLLARGVNGESPTKRQRSDVASPPRGKGKARSRSRKTPKQAPDATPAATKASEPKAKKRQSKAKVTKATNSKTKQHEAHADTPVAGSSKPSRPSPKKPTKTKGEAKGPQNPQIEKPTLMADSAQDRKKPSGKGATRSAANKAKGKERDESRADRPRSSTKQPNRKSVSEGRVIADDIQVETAQLVAATAREEVRRDCEDTPHTGGSTTVKDKAKKGLPAPEPVTQPTGLTRLNRRPDVHGSKTGNNDDEGTALSRRKRPKLYVPSDTESDDDYTPIMAIEKSRRRQAAPTRTKKQGIEASRCIGVVEQGHVARDQISLRRSRGEDSNGKSMLKQDSKTSSGGKAHDGFPDSHASRPLSPHPESAGHVKIGSSQGTNSKPVAKRRTEEHPPEEHPKEKPRATRATKRKVEKVTTHDASAQPDLPHEAADEHARPLKRARRAAADRDTRQSAEKRRETAADVRSAEPSAIDDQAIVPLRTTSRSLKENRTTAKKAGAKNPPRKPKPRLSMFPTSSKTHESEDEIDFLR